MFAAGLMAASASAMQLEETHNLQMPVLAAPKFAAGLIYGMVGVNDLPEITTCATDGWGEIQNVEDIIAALEAGQVQIASQDLVKFADDLSVVLADCKNTKEDIAAITAWAAVFSSKARLIADVSKNLLLHRKKIKNDIATVKTEWAAKDFFQSGVTAADLAYYAIGPI